MTESISDWLKLGTMTPLAEQAALKGICPRCHQKTLLSKHSDGEVESFQCSRCLSVFMLPARRLTG